MTIIQQIREDWGTAKHFCKLNAIKYESLITIAGGKNKSQACVEALIKHGYISQAEDLPQYQIKKSA